MEKCIVPLSFIRIVELMIFIMSHLTSEFSGYFRMRKAWKWHKT